MKTEDYKKEIEKLRKEIALKDKKISQIKKLIHHDTLTGLLNRNGFREEIERYIESIKDINNFKKQKRKVFINNLSFIFIDLNNFKQINDKFGHNVGDKLLKNFSNFLEKSVREIDIISRWSGDEFIISLINSNKEEAEKRIEKIKNELEKKKFGREKIKISASFGVSSVFDNFRKEKWVFNLKKLIDEADIEMYKEKKRIK